MPVGDFHEQDRTGAPVWVRAGTRFGFDELVHFRGKGKVAFDEVAGSIDLILTGPHASGAIPRELEAFVAPDITERVQFDFSDHTTGAIGRRWAAIDERVVYIEFPHHRTMFDPNRPPPEDVEEALREFWRRREQQLTGEDVSFNGVDAVRPVSFGGVEFLRKPRDDAEWAALVGAITTVSNLNPYRDVRDALIESVVEAKCRRLSNVDLSRIGSSDLSSAMHLHVHCIHDTMNATIQDDGAVVRMRPPEIRLPSIVSLGNRGDARGEPRPPNNGEMLAARDVPTITGDALRSVQRALQIAFEVPQADLDSALALNRPYLGAFEVQHIARNLRRLESQAVVRHASGEGSLRVRMAAYQAEFLRELLLGPANTEIVSTPGVVWPEPDTAHVDGLARRLKNAYDILRRWSFDVPPTSEYAAPLYR